MFDLCKNVHIYNIEHHYHYYDPKQIQEKTKQKIRTDRLRVAPINIASSMMLSSKRQSVKFDRKGIQLSKAFQKTPSYQKIQSKELCSYKQQQKISEQQRFIKQKSHKDLLYSTKCSHSTKFKNRSVLYDQELITSLKFKQVNTNNNNIISKPISARRNSNQQIQRKTKPVNPGRATLQSIPIGNKKMSVCSPHQLYSTQLKNSTKSERLTPNISINSNNIKQQNKYSNNQQSEFSFILQGHGSICVSDIGQKQKSLLSDASMNHHNFQQQNNNSNSNNYNNTYSISQPSIVVHDQRQNQTIFNPQHKISSFNLDFKDIVNNVSHNASEISKNNDKNQNIDDHNSNNDHSTGTKNNKNNNQNQKQKDFPPIKASKLNAARKSASVFLSQVFSHDSSRLDFTQITNTKRSKLFKDIDRLTIKSLQADFSQRSLHIQQSIICDHNGLNNFQQLHRQNYPTYILVTALQIFTSCLVTLKQQDFIYMDRIAQQLKTYQIIQQKLSDSQQFLVNILSLYQVQLNKHSYILIKQPYQHSLKSYLFSLKNKQQLHIQLKQIKSQLQTSIVKIMATMQQKCEVVLNRQFRIDDFVYILGVIKLQNLEGFVVKNQSVINSGNNNIKIIMNRLQDEIDELVKNC